MTVHGIKSEWPELWDLLNHIENKEDHTIVSDVLTPLVSEKIINASKPTKVPELAKQDIKPFPLKGKLLNPTIHSGFDVFKTIYTELKALSKNGYFEAVHTTLNALHQNPVIQKQAEDSMAYPWVLVLVGASAEILENDKPTLTPRAVKLLLESIISSPLWEQSALSDQASIATKPQSIAVSMMKSKVWKCIQTDLLRLFEKGAEIAELRPIIRTLMGQLCESGREGYSLSSWREIGELVGSENQKIWSMNQTSLKDYVELFPTAFQWSLRQKGLLFFKDDTLSQTLFSLLMDKAQADETLRERLAYNTWIHLNEKEVNAFELRYPNESLKALKNGFKAPMYDELKQVQLHLCTPKGLWAYELLKEINAGSLSMDSHDGDESVEGLITRFEKAFLFLRAKKEGQLIYQTMNQPERRVKCRAIKGL